ncbi:MAG: AAA family ATPase [Myxococcales bacterium]
MHTSEPPSLGSVPPPAMRPVPLVPSQVIADRYEVRGELARGGMGIVYRVEDRLTGEQRALKRVKSGGERDAFLMEALEREYQVLAGLAHPRIIRVFDFGRVEASGAPREHAQEVGPYYVMELLEGEDLRSAAPLPYREACLYLRDVATSLSLLHARRLLHRDLSPNNVRKTPDGHCKLFDFGALHAFGHAAVTVGTPPAIPPEALRGAALDQRADLYALGALAYWMLTGEHAYPAERLDDLPSEWERTIAPPSSKADDVPRELDALVLALLSHDALARPASAGEVIARLNRIAELPSVEAEEAESLAQSFLRNPPFVGREEELESIARAVQGALAGHGQALRIEAPSGAGRTRLLEEAGMRARLAGINVLRVDASTAPEPYGVVRAVLLRSFEARPAAMSQLSEQHRRALSVLGSELQVRLPPGARLGKSERAPAAEEPRSSNPTHSLESMLVELSREWPFLLAIDNVEDADGASLAVLTALAKRASQSSLCLITCEGMRRRAQHTVGLAALQAQSVNLRLSGLTTLETLALARSLFGDAANVERFAEWLHDSTAGSPLHCLETTRQLLMRGVVRHLDGLWVLPVDRPNAELSADLEEALSVRLAGLSQEARSLAECLALQRQAPSFGLCMLLCAPASDAQVRDFLQELARLDVLHADYGSYRFSSLAIREALLAHIEQERLAQHHRKLGEAFLQLAPGKGTAAEGSAREQYDEGIVRMEAGLHLIEGGDDLRGADLIADVISDSFNVRTLFANLYRAGRPSEAALRVYKYHRRSPYERMPLLASLCHASYYEDRRWGERYGDEALDVLEGVSGLQTARRLQPVFGKHLGLVLALAIAWLRFLLTPKSELRYGFREVMVQLSSSVTSLAGTAAISLDAARAERIANVLEPFSALPARAAPRGIYEFCQGLALIGREHPGAAVAKLEQSLARFQTSSYYRSLPVDGRLLMTAAVHFASGSLSTFRADSRGVLESARALEASGYKLYALVASQLRFLYHMNRGEFTDAAIHSEQVELHAALVGSAWQVEVWESAALAMLFSQVGDVIGLTRVQQRLAVACQTVPSLRPYLRLTSDTLEALQSQRFDDDPQSSSSRARQVLHTSIAWSAYPSSIARVLNHAGRHLDAKLACEQVMAQLGAQDADYVSLFLPIWIEHALARAGLGETQAAREELEALIARFSPSGHPLALGLVHEALARVALAVGDRELFERNLLTMEQVFRPTQNPALIARCERLAASASAFGEGLLLPRPGARIDSDTSGKRGSDAKTVRAQRTRN